MSILLLREIRLLIEPFKISTNKKYRFYYCFLYFSNTYVYVSFRKM